MDCRISIFHMAKAHVARLSGAGALGCKSRLLFAKIAMAYRKKGISVYQRS
jgi:hypothetical protein